MTISTVVKGRRLPLSLLFVAALTLVLAFSPLLTRAGASGTAYVRVNQLGYINGETKQAILMASGSESGATFSIVNTSTGKSVYSAAIGSSKGSWSSAYNNTYLIDFSSLATTGNYQVHVSGSLAATSPTFKIDSASNLYSTPLSNALYFYEAQKDGTNVDSSVMNRQPSHLTDAQASVYNTPRYDSNDTLTSGLTRIGGPINVSGGWFDAGDYVKFVETASYTDAVLLLAAREYPSLNTGKYTFNSEGKYGLDWLKKMWDNTHKILYYQVGIGDGNGGSILGDHDYWRLPQADDAMNVKPGDPGYYVKYRPVFRLGPGGTPISPNLAGRLAADFALCYQVFASTDPGYANSCLVNAENIYALARTSNVGQLVTTAPYDYYGETTWHDDMELGATELYYALAKGNLPSGLLQNDPLYYLKQATNWSSAYINSDAGGDSLNLYDTSGLADFDLYNAIAKAGHPAGLAVSQSDVLNDLRSQVSRGNAQSGKDPFGLGLAYAGADATPHALGLALETLYYDQLTASTGYKNFGREQRNWILGTNAWGSSFIVGAGSTFPHCMQSQIANLAGSLDGTPPLMLGAIPDGPNASSSFSGLSLQNGMRPCPVGGGDPFKAFNGKGAKYIDNVVSWPSSEPADDYTVLSTLVFAGQIASPLIP
jgi:endoglucanase